VDRRKKILKYMKEREKRNGKKPMAKKGKANVAYNFLIYKRHKKNRRKSTK
jgi:hypothetical protein